MPYLLFCQCVHFTHITCTETALQFGTAASWWQRCHAAYMYFGQMVSCMHITSDYLRIFIVQQ